jgi:ABC-2 type transport system permease protein
LKTLAKFTWVEAKLYLREPMAAFFTLAYAPMILLLFGFIYGNDPTPFFGGRGFIDIAIPSYVSLIVVSVGLMSVPIGTASDREKGILRRYYSTPVSPAVYLTANIFVYYIMTFIGFLILLLIGKLVYNMKFEGNYFYVFVGFTLGALAFFAFGFLIASLAPTARVAQIIGMVIAFPMMFLSGAAIPIEVFPDKVKNVSQFIPLTHLVKLMRGLWIGESWGLHWINVLVLLGILIVGGLVSIKIFKWE